MYQRRKGEATPNNFPLHGFMKPHFTHGEYVGVTGFGKSEQCFSHHIGRMTKSDRPGFAVFDPHSSLTKRFGIQLVHLGMTPRMIYDPIAELKESPGYGFCEGSQHPDRDMRAAENREIKSETKAVLLRSRGLLDAAAKPMIEDGLEAVLDLFLNQETPVPFSSLRDVFMNDTPENRYFIEHCTDPRTRRKWEYFGQLNYREWEFRCGPADRIIRSACEIPSLRARDVATFDLASFLNNGGIWLVDGGSQGNLSRQDSSFVMGMLLNRLIQLARSGKINRLVVIIDEGVNSSLIDLNVARALAEARKWNMEFNIIVQNPLRFPHPDIAESINQNCARKFIFRQANPEATKFMAQMCAIPQLDPLKVRNVEKRTRMEHTGEFSLERIHTHGERLDEHGHKTGETSNTGFINRPKYREKTEEFTTYFSFDDQIKQKEQVISCLGVGEFIEVNSRGVSDKQYFPMEPLPWDGLNYSKTQTLAEYKFQKALAEMKATRPEYKRQPVINLVPSENPTRPSAELARRMRGE